MYALHEQLAKDTVLLGRLALSDVLLMNDARYPWVILVPRQDNLSEIYQLDAEDQQQLLAETSLVSEGLATLFNADKINVAALGNMVPQLHIHIIARFKTDAVWPKPIWGVGDAEPYSDIALQQRIQQLQNQFCDVLLDG